MREIQEWIDDLDVDWEQVIVGGALSLMFVFILSLFLQPKHAETHYGIVMGLHYTPSETHTGVGTGIGSNGNPVTIVTTSSSDEKFTLILNENGIYESYDVPIEKFYQGEVGKPLQLECVVGNWFPIEFQCR